MKTAAVDLISGMLCNADREMRRKNKPVTTYARSEWFIVSLSDGTQTLKYSGRNY